MVSCPRLSSGPIQEEAIRRQIRNGFKLRRIAAAVVAMLLVSSASPPAASSFGLLSAAGAPSIANRASNPVSLRIRLDAWDDASRAYSTFESEYRSLRALDKDEMVRLVSAICDADEDERRDVSSAASSRAKDKVKDAFEKLASLREGVDRAIENVLKDTTLKNRYSDANDLKERTGRMWESIEKMTRSVRGANHPVVSYMLEKGQSAHKEYQSSSSNCTVSEFTLTSGKRVDCIYADGATATVVEIKPDNSRARSAGRDQLNTYLRSLREDSLNLQALIAKDSKFKEVKTFTPMFALYRLCPEFNDDGEFKEASVDWRREAP